VTPPTNPPGSTKALSYFEILHGGRNLTNRLAASSRTGVDEKEIITAAVK